MPEIILQKGSLSPRITDFIIEILLKYASTTEKDTSKEKIISDLENKKYGEIFTIEEANEIIGFFSIHRKNYGIFLHKLFISKFSQNQGTGSKVLDFVKKETNEIRLRVNTNNTAKEFYIKNGFVCDHENDGYFTMIWKKL